MTADFEEQAQAVHERVVSSLFGMFEIMCEGTISVDKNARIVWINDKYRKRFDLDEEEENPHGDVERLIPESQMSHVIETGTGKGLLAQSIHAASARANRSSVAVNVTAVPETLLKAEFFRVMPGAYTGADRRRRDGKRRGPSCAAWTDRESMMSMPRIEAALRPLEAYTSAMTGRGASL